MIEEDTIYETFCRLMSIADDGREFTKDFLMNSHCFSCEEEMQVFFVKLPNSELYITKEEYYKRCRSLLGDIVDYIFDDYLVMRI